MRARKLIVTHLCQSGDASDTVIPDGLPVAASTPGAVFVGDTYLGCWPGGPIPLARYIDDEEELAGAAPDGINPNKPKVTVGKLKELKEAGYTVDEIIEMFQHGVL